MIVDIITVLIAIAIVAMIAAVMDMDIETPLFRGITYVILIICLGYIAIIRIIPMPFVWAIIGGVIVNIIVKVKKGRPSQFLGFVAGIFIFFILVFATLLIPTHIVVEQTEAIELLPQDSSGTLLFGTANVIKSYNFGSYAYDVQPFYLYRGNNSPDLGIIDSDIDIQPSENEKGLIARYDTYKVLDLSPWYCQIFFLGTKERETIGSFRTIYVPNGTVKMSPEFALYKGSFNASSFY